MTEARDVGKRPAYQWYPGDFQRDVALQLCSFTARALWREMLDLMHFGEPYGHLSAGNVPITSVELARKVGLSIGVARGAIAELEKRKVFSRTSDGVIYSRRMVRDEHIRNVRAASGKLGGNPALLVAKKDKQNGVVAKPKVQPPDNPRDNLAGKQSPTPAVAVAVAVASAEILPAVVVRGRALEFAAAANKGLAEHAERPQPIPRIIGGNAATQDATRDILVAGVPPEFARSELYALASEHRAEGQVTSLRYFAAAVIRAWERQQASDAAEHSSPSARASPNGQRVPSRRYNAGEDMYANAGEVFASPPPPPEP